MTFTLANKLFFYKEGTLYWKIKISDKINIGQKAGSRFGKYSIVRYNKKSYQVHRIIFLLNHKYSPKTVDHIDRNPRNNYIDNLRAASYNENLRNTTKKTIGHSQYKGVTFDKKSKKWFARIKTENKRINLGYFNNEKDAAKAYNKAALKYFKEFAYINDIKE